MFLHSVLSFFVARREEGENLPSCVRRFFLFPSRSIARSRSRSLSFSSSLSRRRKSGSGQGETQQRGKRRSLQFSSFSAKKIRKREIPKFMRPPHERPSVIGEVPKSVDSQGTGETLSVYGVKKSGKKLSRGGETVFSFSFGPTKSQQSKKKLFFFDLFFSTDSLPLSLARKTNAQSSLPPQPSRCR